MYLITPDTTIALTVILTILATMLVGMRLTQRKKMDKHRKAITSIVLGSRLDDIFCVLALIFVIPTSAIIIWGASKGAIGTHSAPSDVELWITTVTPQWITLAQVVWSILFLQPLALGLIKLSALFFYRRMFMGAAFNIISWITIGFVSAWMAFFSFALFFDCGANVATNWASLAEISEKCWFGFLPTIVYTILDACLDLFILCIPIPFVFALQMSIPTKLSVCACLMLGGLATAAAIVRMSIFIQSGIPSAALHKDLVMGLPAYDIVGIVGAEMFWTMIETNVAMIAICLPTLKKIISLSGFNKRFGLSSFFSRFYTGYQSAASGKSMGTTDPSMTDIELGDHEMRSSRTKLCEEKSNPSYQPSLKEASYTTYEVSN